LSEQRRIDEVKKVKMSLSYNCIKNKTLIIFSKQCDESESECGFDSRRSRTLVHYAFYWTTMFVSAFGEKGFSIKASMFTSGNNMCHPNH